MDTEALLAQDFDEYLRSKKIDPVKFRSAEKDKYEGFAKLYDQVHPDSFTQQKLFLINRIRRQYILESNEGEETKAPPKKMKPKITPKPKLK